ncbi:hypothetical protein [Corynebacterium deserti]|uniref:hypothetical protein n=1 Tax=Corynebacterium deserti TaxID=1408191 RepID=UPI0018D14F7E|nr:hypothetical protein [Corynebacterium deserti]
MSNKTLCITAANVSFLPLSGSNKRIISETFEAIADAEPNTRTPWKLAVLTPETAARAAKSRTTTPWAAHTSSAIANTLSELRPLIALA